jgi:site-specific recombinase XerD
MTFTVRNYNKNFNQKRTVQVSPLRQRMIEDMQLRSLSENTQDRYIKGVKKIACYYKRSPDKINEEEARSFFMYLIKETSLAADTIRVIFFGVKFFFKKTLGREWKIFDLIRLPQKKKLPVVLSYEEVKKVLSHIHHPTYRMCLTLIYACGLRLNECLNLRIKDVDRNLMVVRVVKGKGDKMRHVPLCGHILKLLRQYWRLQRPRPWLFQSPYTGKPISANSIQGAFRDARQKAGINKEATIHTLRHSYATHLLENRVDSRLIQGVLGHTCARSTAIYTHLTSKTDMILNDAVTRLMSQL